MTQTRTGAEALVDALVALDVTTVFGVPGEETTALMAAIERSDMEFILCRHEQAAAFMASVHGRMTSRPAVCLATLGPGATNLVTGVADANLDHVPLIAITGQGARRRIGRDSHQMIDLEALFRPITKLSRNILDADAVPGAVAEAWRQAVTGRPGAVHLCLPEDVAEDHTDRQPVPVPLTARPIPPAETLDEVAAMILQADRPMILAGAGVLRDGAAEPLRALAEATRLVVATTFMGKGILPPDHPQTLFTIGQPDGDYIDLAIEAADLILAVGVDPVELSGADFSCDGRIPVIAIGPEIIPADAGWRMSAQVTGDIGAAVDGLRTRLDPRQWPDVPTFVATRDAMRRTLRRSRSEQVSGPIAPQDICRVISDRLRPEDTVLSGVGLHKLWIARHVTPRRPGQVIVPNGLAGMGLALPGAIAAARLQDTGRVLAICGDGDLMMNLQEMETAARLSLSLTVMVWDDGALRLIEEHDPDGPEYRFGNPGWDPLARAFGWLHARCEGAADLPDLLADAQDAPMPTLISVPVDYDAGGGLPGTKSTHQLEPE
ncbi:MAG: acetolactate synthase large subunit [Rhodobacteraceae bacterium]|nr:acetolactate synthase large subunit [Paracoccaceae bacterium]